MLNSFYIFLKRKGNDMYKAIQFSFIFLMTYLSAEKKIVFLISPPRSLSTAFLRMMDSRGDFNTFNEPSIYIYIKYLAEKDKKYENGKSWYYDNAPRSHQEVQKQILESAKTENTFIKEMGFSIINYHCNNMEMMKKENVYFVFLIRNIHHTFLSEYKKLQVDYLIEEVYDYEALYNFYNIIKKYGKNMPYVIQSEDLYQNTKTSIQGFCNHIGIKYLPESLSWNSIDNPEKVQNSWHEIKPADVTLYWHEDALKSTGFHKPNEYEVDEQGEPTFSEIKNIEHKRTLENLYKKQMPHYQRISSQVIYK